MNSRCFVIFSRFVPISLVFFCVDIVFVALRFIVHQYLTHPLEIVPTLLLKTINQISTFFFFFFFFVILFVFDRLFLYRKRSILFVRPNPGLDQSREIRSQRTESENKNKNKTKKRRGKRRRTLNKVNGPIVGNSQTSSNDENKINKYKKMAIKIVQFHMQILVHHERSFRYAKN